TYATNGRLDKVTDPYYINKYSYPSGSVGYESFKSDNTKDNDLINIVVTNNRITSYDFRHYSSATGLPYNPELNTLQYDANGYLVKITYGSYVYDYTITNGNTVNMKYTDNFTGSIRNTALEYYTDKPNKLNVNLFEEWYLNQYLFDNELLGKKSANLPQKMTYTYGTNTEVNEFSYVMNADGLPSQITITKTVNAGTPTVETINFTYQ
ncbi:MAG: hypothetical protein HYZ42_07495, partial [Bacteroidetes bacterium]|nr:hypothetical protein [Bacteroidota bacterium]